MRTGLGPEEPIVRLWKALKNGVPYVPLSGASAAGAGASALWLYRLSDGVEWVTEPSDTLFVRPEARQIWQLVCEQKQGPSIITGPPGIGKSWALNYFLLQLALQPVVVVLELAASATRFVLQPDGAVQRYLYPDQPADALADKKTWYLFDPDEKDTQPLKVLSLIHI